jgi:hypothetical protein
MCLQTPKLCSFVSAVTVPKELTNHASRGKLTAALTGVGVGRSDGPARREEIDEQPVLDVPVAWLQCDLRKARPHYVAYAR